MQEADLRLRTFQVLYDQESSSSTDERQNVESAMRAKFAQSLFAFPKQLKAPAPANTTTPETPDIPRIPDIPGATSTPAHIAQTTASLAVTSFLSADNCTIGIPLNPYDNESGSADE
jgi:hypothetical protein